MPSAYTYFGLAVGALIATAVLGLGPVTRARPPTIWAKLAPPWFFLIAVCVTLVIWRLPTIALNRQVNADESTFIALAHIAGIGSTPWLDFEATTSGPFDIWPLTALHMLGFGLTYATARSMSVALIFLGILAMYVSLRALFGDGPARVSTVCATAFFATASYEQDFAHYSSETVSLCLLALLGLVLVLLLKEQTSRSILYAAAAGLLVGAIPLAKLQSAPIDAAMMAVAFGVMLGRGARADRRFLEIAAFVLASAAAVAAVLIPVRARGAWDDFVISYIREPLWYTSNVSQVPQGFVGSLNLNEYPSFLIFADIGAAAVLVGVVLCLAPRRLTAREKRPVIVALSSAATIALILAAACYSVARAGEPLGHHLLYPVLPLCAFVGASFAIAILISRAATVARIATIGLVAGLVTVSAAVTVGTVTGILATEGQWIAWNQSGVAENAARDATALVDKIPMGSSLAVWGWAPDVYVLRNAVVGTRGAFTQFQTWPGPYQQYYLDRYLADLRRNAPQYLLDAAGPDNSGLWSLTNPEQRLAHFPSVSRYVAAHYELIGRAAGWSLYRRRATIDSSP